MNELLAWLLGGAMTFILASAFVWRPRYMELLERARLAEEALAESVRTEPEVITLIDPNQGQLPWH